MLFAIELTLIGVFLVAGLAHLSEEGSWWSEWGWPSLQSLCFVAAIVLLLLYMESA